MNMRKFLTALAVTAVSTTAALADLTPQYIDWAQGPVQHIMSREETAKWKTLRSDDDAKAFVALFWARRDPTPDTPRNEFREQFEQRVAYADKNLAAGERIRGAMTDRGRAWILYGTPKRIERSSEHRSNSRDTMGTLQDDQATSASWIQWWYEGDSAKEMFLVPRASIRFIDRMGNNEYKVERGSVDLRASAERAIASTIKQPGLTAAPAFTAAAAPVADPVAAPAAPVATAPTVVTELTTAALATAVTDFKAAAKNPYENKAYSSYGEFVTSDGTTFVPVVLYVPKSAGVSGDNLTFFGVVQDASGKNVLAFEEPAKLSATKDDWFVDKSLSGLPAGKHRGIFGLADASGKPVVISSQEMQLTGSIDKDATEVSSLILSNNLYPLTEAQAPTDPFAFGGIKVVPKADRVFRPSDELWYFFELRNPGIPEVAADATVAVTPDAPGPLPKVQVKMDVVGTATDGKPVKMSAPPREIDAIPMKGVPGHFGIGNAIPLEKFKPGDYTFTVKVIDTVKKTSYTLTDKFKVVQQ